MTGWKCRSGRLASQTPRSLALAVAVVCMAACTGIDPAGTDSRSARPGASTTMSDSPGPASAVPSDGPGTRPTTATVAQLLSDPEPLLGRPVKVVGKVFFLSRCPPPGSGGTTGCALAGYLTEPGRGSFVASDVDQGIALAEGGNLLSCAEGTNPTPTCGDWQAATVYTVSGSLARQVLGGRETPYLQLDVERKVIAH